MSADPSLFLRKIRHLTIALIISGVLNIVVVSSLVYWILRHVPPTPYCQLKPINQKHLPLADQRGCAEALIELSQLSFGQLVSSLHRKQLIENGYAERDLALACLVSLHYLDLERALKKEKQPQQERLFAWKPQGKNAPIMLALYPDMTEEQFNAIIQFAKIEKWPLTAEGLFYSLQKQNPSPSLLKTSDLVDTFALTEYYWTIELLFPFSLLDVTREELISLMIEGDWETLKQSVNQQRELHDVSAARRQQFLLTYLELGSCTAARLLLKTEWEFALKKLSDQQVQLVFKAMSKDLPQGVIYAKEMLTAPRSSQVWKSASDWLYAQSGEPIPSVWSHRSALEKFAPDKISFEKTIQLREEKSLQESAPVPKLKSALNNTDRSPPPSYSSKELKKPLRQMGQDAKLPSTSTYIVQEGDTLWKIGKKFGVKVEELKEVNRLQTDTLKKGMTLKIPNRSKSS